MRQPRFIVFLLIVVFGTVGCGGGAVVQPPSSGTYTNPTYGYTITYPTSFSVDQSSLTNVSVVTEAPNGFRVEIYTFENPNRLSLRDWIRLNDGINVDDWNRLQDGTASREDLTINGVQAIRLRQYGEGEVISTYIRDDANSRIFVVDAYGMDADQIENFERTSSTALDIMGSFRVR